MAETQAWAEWRRYGYLPIIAAFGSSTSTLGIYSMGAFMRPLQAAFGWGRAEASSGILIASAVGIVAAVPIGMLVDRIGPRRVGLIGVTLATFAFGLLGTITGAKLDWLLHWLLIACGGAFIMPAVWASAVSSRFEASRGLALGVTLCGAGIGATAFPLLGTWLIVHYGWRGGFIGLGAVWAALVLPLLLLFFRGANDGAARVALKAAASAGAPAVVLPGLTVREGLTGTAFYKLLLAGGTYALVLIGLIVHLIPILEDRGTAAMTAAAMASTVGIFSVFGRLATGALMDRWRPNVVGGVSFMLPTLGCALLLMPTAGTAAQVVAIAIIGLSVGGELGVVTYLSTRYFGLRSFGKLFGGVTIPMAIGTACGPILAGAVFDQFHSYTPFLWLTIALMLVGALALFALGRPPEWPATAPTP